MHITSGRTELILVALQEKHNAEWCEKYGEKGYTDPEKGIIFCNWNNVSKRIQDYLEKAGYELEWEDEWTIDYDYGKAYRISPDSYGWQSAIHYTDSGEMLTPDDDITDWIEEFQNNPRKALPSRITPERLMEEGWELRQGGYENGFFNGQDDDPAKAYKEFKDEYDVLFRLSEVSQFYLRFEVWLYEKQDEDC